MDEFDFEELIADMMDISDKQREDDDYLPQQFLERYDYEIAFDSAYKFALDLLQHVPTVTAGMSGKEYHAFVSKTDPIMLMKIEAKGA